MSNKPIIPRQEYQFTNDWFGVARPVWTDVVPRYNPQKILEIGSYEGASTCFLIDLLGSRLPLEIHCVDSWQGGVEHDGFDMQSIETRFRHNTALAIQQSCEPVELVVHKGLSDLELCKLVAAGKQEYFDFIYVDGSHQAPDVICDAILAFKLLRIGGLLVFDDYLWAENLPPGIDPVRCPKPAVDAFTNLYCRKLTTLRAPLYQLYVEKVSN